MKNNNIRPKLIVGISIVLVLIGLFPISVHNYLFFHCLIEIFSIVVAFGIFIVAWNSRRFLANNYLLFLGTAYLFIGGVDLIHTLGYKGMGVFQRSGGNLSTQLWIISRYLESLSLLTAFLFVNRKLKSKFVFLGYTAVITLLLMAVFYWRIFPQCFIEGVGLTLFKKVSEYIISLILIGSIILLFKNRREFDRGVLQLLSISIAITIVSELVFTFYVDVYGLSNIIGHFLKLLSFYLIYKAIVETGFVKPYSLLFRNLKQSETMLQKAKDGLEVRVEERTTELSNANKQLQAQIAERKRAEEEILKLNQELEHRVAQRTAELEAFSYSVSHDLRAPLRAIDGFVHILLEDYSLSLDAEGKDVCSVISKSARDMGKLIDDLLTFSRLGRAEIAVSQIDMTELANSTYDEQTAPEERVRIDFHVGSLPRIQGDPTLIRQVWRNLLSNAVKFSSKKDRAIIDVRGEEIGDEVVYSVRDNGAGFDMQYVDKIFGVFQRLHGTKEFEGTGVGLAIVERIVHRHGGRVWAEGEVGKGATFHFAISCAADVHPNQPLTNKVESCTSKVIV